MAPLYQLTDFTSGGFPNPDFYGLNNHDEAVGDSVTVDGSDVNISGWVAVNPGNVVRANVPHAKWTVFFAVNDSGDSVGFRKDGNDVDHGFLYQQGQFIDLNPRLARLGAPWSSIACDINNDGVIVGTAIFGPVADQLNRTRGFIYDPRDDSVIELGSLEGLTTSHASAINVHGDVVGWSDDGDTQRRPFLYRGGVMQELTGQPGLAFDINDHGHVVGADKGALSFPAGAGSGAFFWADGNLVPIPVNGLPRALNNRDEVVGSGFTNAGREFAWRFTTNDGLLDLNTALAKNYGIGLIDARDINDAGRIAAGGFDKNYKGYAVMLTPDSGLMDLRPILTLAAEILFGVTQDGAGLARLGNKPFPVDPWGPLSERQREQLEARTREVIERLIDDPELRLQAFNELRQILYGEQE